MNPSTNDSSAQGVVWELRDLYAGIDDPAITRDLETALERARAFESAYRGTIAVQCGPPAELLAAAFQELEGLAEQMDRPVIYAGLVHAAKTDDPRHGALVSRTREQRTAINQHLIFFDLEWIQVPEEAACRLLGDPRLARFRHYLEQKRAWKPHYLSEPEEKVLEEKGVTGRAAFVRLFDESVAALLYSFEYGGKKEQLPF